MIHYFDPAALKEIADIQVALTGPKRVPFIPWDSRKKGFTPDMFRTTEVFYDTLAEDAGEIPWLVVCNGKVKTIRTPKEYTCKEQHLYAYVDMIVGDKVMSCRSMSLAALIWLCYLKRSIPAGCVVDHTDEDPYNNAPSNLQLLTVGDNTRKSAHLKRKTKEKIV